MIDVTLLMTGTGLGFTAGLSPGPIQTLLISQTLMYGMKEGMFVAFAPLVTDLPIFLMSVLLLSQLTEIGAIMGVLSLIGAAFLLYLAHGNFRVTAFSLEQRDHTSPRSLRKGIMANFLNPHPYMFWLLVGAPLIVNASRTSIFFAGSFVIGFYIILIGTLMSISLLVGKFRSLLKGRAYIYTMRALGVLLIIFAGRFLLEGLKLFGVFQ